MPSLLYLLPAYLSENSPKSLFGPIIGEIISKIDHYFVENEKTARKVIKYFCPDKKQAELKLYLLDKYTQTADLKEAQSLMKQGLNFAILSEAGLPCIADPGNIMVKWAHQNHIKVVPINGPSSIILALVASGFNGQEFSFNGYLPIDKEQRKKKILQLEQLAIKQGVTQIFMETPYRNQKLLQDLCSILNAQTKLCVAANITDEHTEYIKTQSIELWKKSQVDFHKIPTIFIIGA
jgi:16S rRNA (cytidine1402-2'-O)-methyltransferase